jgi:hypothetical protein
MIDIFWKVFVKILISKNKKKHALIKSKYDILGLGIKL